MKKPFGTLALRQFTAVVCIFSMATMSFPFAAFAQGAAGNSAKLPSALAQSGPRKLAMLRGSANESVDGAAELSVQASQKYLALMVTDQEGEELAGHGLDLNLRAPGGAALREMPIPKLDPATEAQFTQYRARIASEARIGSEKNPDVIADKLAAAAGRVPMPAGLDVKMRAQTAKLTQIPNLAFRIRNAQTRKVEAMIVMNPTPGPWKASVGGKARQNFFATLAGGDSLRAIGQDSQLWQTAVRKLAPIEEEEMSVRGPSVGSGSFDPAVFATGVSCTVCKITVRAIIIAGSFVVGGVALFIAMALGVTAPLATLVIQLLFTFVPMGLANDNIAKRVCKAIKLCN